MISPQWFGERGAGSRKCQAVIGLSLPQAGVALLAIMFFVSQIAANPLSVLETKIQPPLSEAAEEDRFGAAVAVDGDRVAIGVPNAHNLGWHQGAVDVYERLPDGSWQREAVLLASDGQRRDGFGQVVALDGDTLVVAGHRSLHDPDAELLLVYVFTRGRAGWVEEQSFVIAGDYGARVAVLDDRFVVSLPDQSGVAGAGQGAVYVYHRTALGWLLEVRLVAGDPQEGAHFGTAVDFENGQMLVSAPQATTEPEGRKGVAYVFELVDQVWTQTARIANPLDTGPGVTFGGSVAIEDGVAAVGLPRTYYRGGGNGALVFEREDGVWAYVTRLAAEPNGSWEFDRVVGLQDAQISLSATDGLAPAIFVFARQADGWTERTRLVDLPAQPDAWSYAIFDTDDSTLCVGTPWLDGPSGDEQGAVFLYHEGEDGWSLDATLRRADGVLSDDDYFGGAVATEGDLLLAGAPEDCDAAGCAQGSAYVFRRVDGLWLLSEKLLAPDAAAEDRFGTSVAISGNRFIIGALGADTPVATSTGAAYIFRQEAGGAILEARLHAADGMPGDWFGCAVAIDGDRAIVGAYKANRVDGESLGAAYVFAHIDGEWVQQARLAVFDPVARPDFGISVAIDGDRAVVGAYRGNGYRGAAYVFAESLGSWTEESRLIVDDAGRSIWFGLSVGIEGDTIAIGAPRVNNPGGCDVGRVFIFSHIDDVWERQASLRADQPSPGARFGGRLALRDGRLAIGAGGERSDLGWAHGAAYLFHRSDDGWSQALRVTASDTHALQYFAKGGVAVDRSHFVVGVPFDGNGTGMMPGAVYDYSVVCPGDVDGDWIVDQDDLLTLLSSYGTPSGASRESGDLDGDGDVDVSDLGTLLAVYETTCG